MAMEKRVRPAWPKRKVALMMGYAGTGYQGMQLNPGAKTIEEELFKALCAEELVSEDNAVDPKKVAWMRACRTDKGVHAAGQVVSFKMLLKGGDQPDALNALTAGLNARLPEQIRIFGIKRTTGSFHAKERTDSRIYEYLIPTYAFRPVDPTPYAQERPATEVPWDPAVPAISEELKGELKSYRIPTDLLERVRQALKVYIGTHSFHNFTIGKGPEDLSSRRHIMDVSVGEPWVQDGASEWLSIKFHGQSFMLHQIRKMVGLVVMTVRLGVPSNKIARFFDAKVKVNIPKAPALGLLLDRAILQQYNQRTSGDLDPIDFLEYEEERTLLKSTQIYPRIFQEEQQSFQFQGWLQCNDDHASEFSFLLNLS